MARQTVERYYSDDYLNAILRGMADVWAGKTSRGGQSRSEGFAAIGATAAERAPNLSRNKGYDLGRELGAAFRELVREGEVLNAAMLGSFVHGDMSAAEQYIAGAQSALAPVVDTREGYDSDGEGSFFEEMGEFFE